MELPNDQFIHVLAREAFLRRKVVVALFVIVSLGTLVLGLFSQKHYTSGTTILVQDKNVIQPLMKGTAVDAGETSRASVARAMIHGHHFMARIARDAGLINARTTPKQESAIIHQMLIPHIRVTHVGDNRNLIRIQYTDTNPKRTYFIARDLTDRFIATTLADKAKQSQNAFDFINQQVLQYRAKLTEVENSLKKFQSANLTTRPGSETQIGKRLNHLQDEIDRTSEQLRETEIKRSSLRRQLNGEARATAEFALEGQYAARIARLQTQLATLRLNYRDTYPDIVQIKHEIADLRLDIAKARERAKAAKSGKEPALSESLVLNPLYQHLRQELSQTQTLIATLEVRLADYRSLLAEELKRGREVHSGEATLAELTRDYNVNRDIYQDLLRRRENARVTMNLDKQREGLSFQIQSQAELPHVPEGLRFADFLLGSLFLGLGLPLALVYAKVKFDPRVCAGPALSERLKLPLMAVIPHLSTPLESEATVRSVRLLGVVVAGDLMLIVTISALKLAGVLK